MSKLPLLLQVLREPARIRTLGLADWDVLLRQATNARLVPALHKLLDACGQLEHVPSQARSHFDWTATLAERHSQAVHWELAQIGRALSGLGMPLILLKGAAYAAAGLPPAGGRMFSDIDILVPKARLGEVEAALMMHGWASNHHDEYDQRYYRDWMHELPPMQHVKRETLIDVHHAILPLTARACPDPAKLLAAAVPAGSDTAVLVLAPADMVLHSAVHLFSGEFEHGLRDLVDIHRLLGHFDSAAFWETLVARARELELGRPLFYALRMSTKLLGTAVPEHVMLDSNADAPNRMLLAAMDALLVRAIMPDHHSCSTAATAVARFALYVRSNWLRMPPLMLARHLLHKAFLSPRPR